MELEMESIHAGKTASITELKKNPSSLIKEACGEPVAILNNNKTTAYLIPAETYEKMLEKLEDRFWIDNIREREKESAIEVDIDDL